MNGFEEGYYYFENSAPSTVAASLGGQYVDAINQEIDKLVNDLNSFEGFKSDIQTLKGDVAEFWHADSFNIDAVLKGSSNKAVVNRSHDYASADISTNFGDEYGLKYYGSGIRSAKQQAKSIFEKFKEYQGEGGKDSIEDYLQKRGYTDDIVLSDPIYSGQMRLIPSEQMDEAIRFLEQKIAKEQIIRPEQVKRYQETLDKLRDCIKDNEGTQSYKLDTITAKDLARLAKEGNIDAEKLGLTTEELMNYEYILKESFKAGLTSATIAMALKVAPEIINAIKYLIDTGEVDKRQFKELGFAAIEGAGDGFIKGAISSAITTACKSGLLGEAVKRVNPSIIGAVTVIAVDTMKNAYNVTTGKMTQRELANELVKEMFTSTCSLVCGFVAQSLIQIPVFGFMVGSFVGSVVGSISYNLANGPVMSFCVSTGFTMFGLVDQNYEIPEDVMKELGFQVFEYDQFSYDTFEPERFEFAKFEFQRFEPETIDIHFLRRGVIGVSKIGFIG